MDTLGYENSGGGIAQRDRYGGDDPASEQPGHAGGQGHHDVPRQEGQATEQSS